MKKHKIIVKLLTESIFASGHSIPGSVDLEIVHDEYGFPYMKAKTFKGNLREEMEGAVKILDGKYNHIVEDLLGKENQGLEAWSNLKFSHCRIKENIRKPLEYAMVKGEISPFEIKDALTEIRKFNSTGEDGSTSKGSLRQIRVIKKDLEFEVDIHTERRLTDEELGLLAISLKSLRHLGSMRTRGKGEVECTLHELIDGKYVDKTDYYAGNFFKEVTFNE